ncbi:unnamed protein product [Caenorhabditis angaria]|uniref:Uncharacterized protein n=1 Tax=Caenorhabditis angaria TaxID=860376 RepID=A0A9P1II06_9PELO|nr:unnamed protein product [Caenorhabditis angaria]
MLLISIIVIFIKVSDQIPIEIEAYYSNGTFHKIGLEVPIKNFENENCTSSDFIFVFKGEKIDCSWPNYEANLKMTSNLSGEYYNLTIICPSDCQICENLEKCKIEKQENVYYFNIDKSRIDIQHVSEHGAQVFHMNNEERNNKLTFRITIVILFVVALLFFGFVYGSEE